MFKSIQNKIELNHLFFFFIRGYFKTLYTWHNYSLSDMLGCDKELMPSL